MSILGRKEAIVETSKSLKKFIIGAVLLAVLGVSGLAGVSFGSHGKASGVPAAYAIPNPPPDYGDGGDPHAPTPTPTPEP